MAPVKGVTFSIYTHIGSCADLANQRKYPRLGAIDASELGKLADGLRDLALAMRQSRLAQDRRQERDIRGASES